MSTQSCIKNKVGGIIGKAEWLHDCNISVCIIDIHWSSQNLHYLDSDMGLKMGSLGFFPSNHNNRDSSGAYVTCIYCGLRVQKNTRTMPHGTQRLWTLLFCVCFFAKTWRPPIWAHGWRRHYTGRYRRTGISHLYLWSVCLSLSLSFMFSLLCSSHFYATLSYYS